MQVLKQIHSRPGNTLVDEKAQPSADGTSIGGNHQSSQLDICDISTLVHEVACCGTWVEWITLHSLNYL